MKTILLKLIVRAAFAIALLLVGFAAGFPMGQSIGFTSGSEWSLMQADLLAREAGVFMPVNYKEGTFHVIVKQPRHLYRKAQQLADRQEQGMAYVNTGDSGLIGRVQLAQRTSLTQ